jgi:hypothetical protein
MKRQKLLCVALMILVMFGPVIAGVFAQSNPAYIQFSPSAVKGASHGITPCSRCEQSPGQYSNTVKNFFDYVAAWINGSFNGAPRFPK